MFVLFHDALVRKVCFLKHINFYKLTNSVFSFLCKKKKKNERLLKLSTLLLNKIKIGFFNSWKNERAPFLFYLRDKQLNVPLLFVLVNYPNTSETFYVHYTSSGIIWSIILWKFEKLLKETQRCSYNKIFFWRELCSSLDYYRMFHLDKESNLKRQRKLYSFITKSSTCRRYFNFIECGVKIFRGRNKWKL